MPGRPQRIGRPPKPPTPGERVSLGLKVTAEIKARLDAEARVTGKTQSRVAEALIERALGSEKLLPGLLEAAYGSEVAGLLLFLAACLRRTLFVAESAVRQSGDSPSSYLEHPWINQQIVQVLEQGLKYIRLSDAPTELDSLAALPPDQREYFYAYGSHSVRWALLTLLSDDTAHTDLEPFTAEIRRYLEPTIARIEEQPNVRKRRPSRQK